MYIIIIIKILWSLSWLFLTLKCSSLAKKYGVLLVLQPKMPMDSELDFEYTWMDTKTYKVENYINMSIKNIKSNNYKFVVIGDGDVVISQLPKSGEYIKEGSEVVLFTW